MGRHGIKRTCVCVDCGARGEMSKPDARRASWDVWLGGARCASCTEKLGPKGSVEFPALKTYSEVVIVACSACEREMESTQMYTDGWRPSIHWTKDPELVQASRDSRAARVHDPKAKIVPLPLCPGWNKAGRVVRVEHREMLPPEVP